VVVKTALKRGKVEIQLDGRKLVLLHAKIKSLQSTLYFSLQHKDIEWRRAI
jgi:hypothetical protein